MIEERTTTVPSAKGDAPALDVSAHDVERLSRSLHAAIRRRGVDAQTADDVVQEAWLRALRARPALQAGARFGGWLRVVGLRLLDEMRRANHQRHARERVVARPERDACADEPGTRVLRLVAELAEPYREVVRLRFFEQLECHEIALRLGRPEATVRSQLGRALERLRERLRAEEAPRRAHLFVPWLLGLWRGTRVRAALGCAAGLALLLWIAWWRTEPRASAAPGETRIAAVARAEEPAALPARVRVDLPPAPDALGTPPAPASPAEPRRTIGGRVLTPAGLPRAGAELWRGSREGAGTSLGLTDASGSFVVAGLAPQEFLWASADAWCPSRRAYVASIPTADRHDLVLNASSGRLALRVRAADGAPAAGAEVQLAEAEPRAATSVVTAGGALEIPPHVAVSGVTDADGRLRLAVPSAARVALTVRCVGRTRLVQTLELEPRDQELELILPAPAAVAGVVLEPSGRPAAGAVVLVRQFDDTLEELVTADERGRFESAARVPGGCLLVARLARGAATGFARLELQPGERAEVRLETRPEYALRGQVLDGDQPVRGARVHSYDLVQSGLPATAEETTDAEGRFVFGATPGARYQLELVLPGDEHPCAWSGPVGAGDEAVLRVQPGLRTRVPLSVEFQGVDPAHPPQRVVFRSLQPHVALEVPVEPVTLRASALLPPLPMDVVVWVSGVGFWSLRERLVADGTVQRVLLPRLGVLELALAPGFEAVPTLGVGGFNPFGRDGQGAFATVRELELDASRSFLRAELFPGRYRYGCAAPGFAELGGIARVDPGQLTSLSLAPERGVEIELVVRLPRPLAPNEVLRCSVRGPLGVQPLRSSQELRRAPESLTLALVLPPDAEGLGVSSNAGLVGELELAPGALDCGTLDSGARRPAFRLELEPQRK